MIVTVTMKCPDAVRAAAREAVQEIDLSNHDVDDREWVLEAEEQKIYDAISKWFEYGEYATIEIDTERGIATVLKRG